MPLWFLNCSYCNCLVPMPLWFLNVVTEFFRSMHLWLLSQKAEFVPSLLKVLKLYPAIWSNA
uniref:Uncharacterized protein n=1 Tax=Anguilla anguilla TaxID=7936 RepID=A0A0E9UKX1_ANGAN